MPIDIPTLFSGYQAENEPGEKKWFLESQPGLLDEEMTVEEALEVSKYLDQGEDGFWFVFHLCGIVKKIPDEMAQYLLTKTMDLPDPARLKECLVPCLKNLGFYKTQAIILAIFPKLNDIKKGRAVNAFYWSRPTEIFDDAGNTGYLNWWEDKEILDRASVSKTDEDLTGIQTVVFSKVLQEASITSNDSLKTRIFQFLPREKDYYTLDDWNLYKEVF